MPNGRGQVHFPKSHKSPNLIKIESTADIDELTAFRVVGAYYEGQTQYIGRTGIDNKTGQGSAMIGPVIKEKGLLLRDAGGYTEIKNNFEVLTEDPSEKLEWVRFRSDGGFLETATPICLGSKSDGRKVYVGRVDRLGVIELTGKFPLNDYYEVPNGQGGQKIKFKRVDIHILCTVNKN